MDMKKVREEIRGMIVDGVLKPAEVLERARDPESALHPFFDWADTEATGAFRLYQTRILIRRALMHVVMNLNAQEQAQAETEAEPVSNSG